MHFWFNIRFKRLCPRYFYLVFDSSEFHWRYWPCITNGYPNHQLHLLWFKFGFSRVPYHTRAIMNFRCNAISDYWFFIASEQEFGLRFVHEYNIGGWPGVHCHYLQFLWLKVGISKLPW